MDLAVDLDQLRRLVGAIPDPEVPVLTIDDLGVLRAVEIDDDDRVVVTITPTYSGCPAMHHIEESVRAVLVAEGVDGHVRTVLSPAWTTDWMSAEGREKLGEYGIAPPRPVGVSVTSSPVTSSPVTSSLITCPQCGSTQTEIVSEFGSTACKALRRCLDCREPFDHFKEL
jgi:ring-1,2-phenylacetyl-CoA epoxidase subunit PaaD